MPRASRAPVTRRKQLRGHVVPTHLCTPASSCHAKSIGARDTARDHATVSTTVTERVCGFLLLSVWKAQKPLGQAVSARSGGGGI
jgi:hypothetical protein